MENILPGDSPSTGKMIKVEIAQEFKAEPLTEEVVLYDECGDTQWDKVLAQHDLADQLSTDLKK